MKKVLVVDDKEENRYYLQALLGARGFQVEVARNGAEALELARKSSPTAVISDLLMPVMDGYTLLRHWKTDPVLQRSPFIVYTATYTESDDEKLAYSLGADAFILKPAEPDAFLKALQEVLAAPVKSGTPDREVSTSDAEVLRQYSETLIRKLEEKSMQLQQANALLEQDIAHRKQIEAALRESEQRFRLLTRATSDAVWDWDFATDVVWWGLGFRQLFGHHLDGATTDGDHWKSLIHPDDRERVVSSFEAAVRDSDSWKASYRFKRADGTWALVEDKGVAIRDSEGKAIRMVGGLSDVSERAALEDRLRVAERLKAIGQLTGGLAHDFNNLLTVVLGNAETLVELLEDDPKKRELAHMIVGAAERGADLTQRLLAFARRQSLTPSPVDVNSLLTGLALMVGKMMGPNIRMQVQSAQDLPPAMVDAAQLEHSLLNLCVNARDAMPDGGVLALSTEAVINEKDTHIGDQIVPAGSYVKLQVKDTGRGIKPEHIDRVFEPFFTTKAEGKGTGLGLAMVYGFVRQSGGYILVDSEPGQGSCFALYFPIATTQPVNNPEQTPTEPRTPCNKHQPESRCCILLVEDDVLVRQITTHNLESLGYRVVAAGNGDAALVLVDAMLKRGEQIDLLFTDVQMAGMTGPELVAKVQKIVPGIRVLYASGYAGEMADSKRLPGSPLPVLGKPYRRPELAAAIEEALSLQ